MTRKRIPKKINKSKSTIWGLYIYIIFALITVFITSLKVLTPSKGSVDAASTRKDLYGIAAGSSMPNLKVSELNKYLDDYHSLGVQWIRFDIPWAWIQPDNTPKYNWAPYDAIVNAANARGIKVLGIIFEPPQWAVASSCTRSDFYKCPPRSTAEYAAFAATVTSHYAPMGVHNWEIWNEPNNNMFWTKPNVSDYTALLKAAYPAIKQADPSAFILTGGTSPASTDGTNISPVDFLNGIYQNGGKGYFDAVAHHPYCYNIVNCPGSTAGAWSQMQGTNPSLRSIMISQGDQDKKIWATEFGAPTGGAAGTANEVTEDQQMQMLNKAYALFSSYSWSGPLFWYTFHDPCSDKTSNECYFGLIRKDGSPKPASALYKGIATGIVTMEPTQTPSRNATSNIFSTSVESVSESGSTTKSSANFSFTLKTTGSRTVNSLIIAIRDPYNTGFDIRIKTNYLLRGNQSFQGSENLTKGTYSYWIAYHSNNIWTDLSPKQYFTVN